MDTARWIKSIIRCIICGGGIIGNNWLWISSLPKSISQLRTNDILFINLAVSNLITNYFVDAFNMFHSDRYIPVGKLYCGSQFFLPEFSQTSSIFTTLFITMYWHQKLVGSLKRGGAPVQMENLHFITVLLTGSWTFSFVINIPHFVFAVESSENMTIVECMNALPSQQAKQAYRMVYIIVANVLPLTGILFGSIQITITLLLNEKRMRKKSTAVRNDGNASAEKSGDDANNVSTVTKPKSQSKSGSLVRAAKSVVAVAFFFLICWVSHLMAGIVNTVSESSLIKDIERYVGASYTCIIPYIYLHGVQKLTCSRCYGCLIGQEEGVSQ